MISRFFATGLLLRGGVWQTLATLVLGALLTAGAAAGARTLLLPAPEEWVCSQFCKTAQESEKVRSLERAFRKSCSPECARMCAAQQHVRALMKHTHTITPEIKAALETAARARSAAALAVLEHVYAVAEVLPESRREEYLRAVLPAVAECCCTP